MKPTNRMAILWSVNPAGDYSPEHDLVGSVLAHMAHIERYDAVYWDLITGANLDQFKQRLPMSEYLYCTDTKRVDYRVRVIDVSFGPTEGNDKFVPAWRRYDNPEDYLFILIDHIDRVFPPKRIHDFLKMTDGKAVKSPPIGGFTRILDPLF